MAKIRNYVGSFASGIGFWIGAVICVPLVLFLLSKVFFGPHNTVSEDDILSYMKQSEQIEVKMPPYKSELYVEDFGNKTQIQFLARGGKGSSDVFWIIFYSEEYKKYFTIWFFTGDGFMYVTSNMENEYEVYLTVNKSLMDSPDYGTKENPVPVLKVVGVDKSLRYQDQDQDTKYMDWVYRTNVERYLGYEMPKKEFKKMFRN